MEKILEFLKTLIIPTKMAKYRYMSVLLSVIIFMVSVYLLTVPMTNHINNSKTEMKEHYNYLVLGQIESRLVDNEESLATLRSLADLGCAVVNGRIECENLTKTEENDKVVYEIFNKEVVITVDGITKRINFVVDLNKETPDFEDVVIDIKDVPYVSNEEVYKVLILPTALYYQAHQRGIETEEVKHNGVDIRPENRYYDYQTYMPDFTLKYDEASARGIGGFVQETIIQADIKALNSQLYTYLFFIMFILPIILVFILWLVFKKNGKLTTYKEYYNIAAIASIAPIVITFIVNWFWKPAVEYYMYLFMLFYIYSLYKINNSPDEVA